MKRFHTLFLILVLAVGVSLTGCDGFLGSSPVEGQIRVLMTDAPADIVEANVTIERVELIGNDDAVIELSSEAQEFNLLDLQDGVTAELAEVSIPEGAYSQLRIVVADEARVKLDDESEHTLTVPSGAQTGIKILFPEFSIAEESDAVEVLVDFDVEESFVPAGETETYVFQPVIKPEYIEVNGTRTDLDDGSED